LAALCAKGFVADVHWFLHHFVMGVSGMAGESNKRASLHELAIKRQQATWPRQEGFKNLDDYMGGRFECNHVSPYTRAAGNVDSDILVFLQDWTSDAPKSERELAAMDQFGRTPWRPTNKKLDSLIETHFDRDISQIYATNLFPFIKSGGMSDGVYRRHLERAAREFAKPHIAILRPTLVIVLGRAASQAFAHACSWDDGDTPFGSDATSFYVDGATVWGQPHPAARIATDKMDASWKRMAEWYKTREGRDA
jgi:restriction system protein